jgi:hypothetical protein
MSITQSVIVAFAIIFSNSLEYVNEVVLSTTPLVIFKKKQYIGQKYKNIAVSFVIILFQLFVIY